MLFWTKKGSEKEDIMLLYDIFDMSTKLIHRTRKEKLNEKGEDYRRPIPIVEAGALLVVTGGGP